MMMMMRSVEGAQRAKGPAPRTSLIVLFDFFGRLPDEGWSRGAPGSRMFNWACVAFPCCTRQKRGLRTAAGLTGRGTACVQG